MELEKRNDVLGNLYALRGGLSAISVEYDKARNTDRYFYEQLHYVANRAGGAQHAPDSTVKFADWLMNGGFESELYDRSRSISNKFYHDQSTKNSKRKQKEEDIERDALWHHKRAIKFFIAMVFLLLIPVGAAIGIACIIIPNPAVLQDWNFALGLLINFYSIIVYLASFITAMVYMGKGISHMVSYRKGNKNYKNAQASNIELTQYEREQLNSELARAQQNIDKLDEIRLETKKILEQRNGAIIPIIQNCNVFFTALVEQFTPLLDERDWQHLDLVIYELETRRAESIKEALQLVDRELQTERIERTIGEATRTICYTLQRGFIYLQHTIEICCDKICSRLNKISSQLDTMSMQMTIQSLQLAEMSGQLAELTDSVNMGNALQAKANVTSAQLLSDVHAIRYYQ